MIDITDLKAWLGVTGATDDTLLSDLEARAVAYLEQQTGRYFGPVTSPQFEEILPGLGTRDLWLSEPAAALPATVEETAYPGASVTTITATASNGYEMRGTTRLVRKGAYVWTQGYEYTVAYDRGYATDAEPGDIRQAVLDLCKLAYRSKSTSAAGGIISETIGNYSYRLSEAAVSSDPTVRQAAWSVASTIESWRRPVLA